MLVNTKPIRRFDVTPSMHYTIVILGLIGWINGVAGAGQFDIELIREYVSKSEFQSRIYSLISCDDTESRKIVKAISGIWHGITGIYSPKIALQAWVNFEDVQTFIIDMKCSDAARVLQEADELNLFRKPFTWLVLDHLSADSGSQGADQVSHDRFDFFKTLYLPLHSDFKVSLRFNENSDLKSLYKLSFDGSLIAEDLGRWRSKHGFEMEMVSQPASRRNDFKGIAIPASVVLTDPDSVNHLDDIVDKQIDSISKVNFALLREVAHMYNSSLSVKFVNSWGTVDANGTWSGMVGDLQSGVSELGATPLFMLASRFHILEYFAMLSPTRGKFIFISPPLSYSSNIFTLPFHPSVWYSCLAMLVVSSLILHQSTKIENRRKDRIRNDPPKADGEAQTEEKTDKSSVRHINDLDDSMSDVLLLSIGVICQQGTYSEPRGLTGRIITAFLYFAYMFLYVSYSACIVALLQSSDTSIRTHKDLTASPLTLGIEDISYNRYLFPQVSDPIRKELYVKKIAPKGEAPHYVGMEEGIRRVQQGLYAFHAELSRGYFLVQKTFREDEKCGLQEIDTEFIQAIDPYLAIKKHSPFTETFKIGLKKITERGFQNRQLRRIYTKKPICGTRAAKFVSVGLADCYPAFMVLAYGFFISALLVSTERLVKQKICLKCLQKRSTKNKRFVTLGELTRI